MVYSGLAPTIAEAIRLARGSSPKFCSIEIIDGSSNSLQMSAAVSDDWIVVLEDI